MNYLELIKKRHSVRTYTNRIVEKEKLDKILEAAILAPTAANKQSFKVYVISTKDKMEVLKKVYPKEWFGTAPYVLCVCTIPSKCWVRNNGKNYSDVDAAIVMDHMILEATELGLGTCWIGAFNLNAARELLGVDETYEPVVFSPIGYTDDNEFKKLRKPIKDIVIYK
ncbi:nitroreductase family protein [Clostridium algoriphilum]|uniref:nitroreductase family protein n=1 Tax=Clostridium algoriphilum TaxID=198347 RepID=UPI001CF5B134|nr:nitroreductase family protein [Clostridium algoriphilum]MCB2295858.1 nitroreductase family protein [Clostridium algoriphilum]